MANESGGSQRLRTALRRSLVHAVVGLSMAASAGIVGVAASPQPALAVGPNAVVNLAGCQANQLPPDTNNQSSGPVSLPFSPNFYGSTFSALYVNQDGSVSFEAPLDGDVNNGMFPADHVIAPFFAAASTSGTDTVRYGVDAFGGRPAFCVNWLNVTSRDFPNGTRNSFQLLLVDRADTGPGDFDIIFNYDRIEWETSWAPCCPDPITGFFPVTASAGYDAGTGTRFELPPGFGSGGFVDSSSSGLIHHSIGTTQLGRYVLEVRNNPVGTSAVHGTITGGTATNPLPGAKAQLCPTAGGHCVVTMANGAGQYSIVGRPAGNYSVTVFPPANTTFSPVTVGVNGLAVGEDRQVDALLPVPVPIPPTTTIINTNMVDGVPVVNWGNTLTLTTTDCPGGTATWEVRQGSAVVQGYSGTMSEGPAGTYTGSIPPLLPTHGAAEIVIRVTCPDGTLSTVAFNIYIDPSGVVVDTASNPVVSATVTLWRSDAIGGPFTQVPNGDAIMSPANRTNPDFTDGVGHFGWDVIAGFYKVRAQKANCHAPGNPGQAFVDTAVLTIPPPVTDLNLVLQCAAPTETTVPTCSVSGLRAGPPVEQDITVRDTGSGLRSIKNIQVTNGHVLPYTFAPATTGPVVLTARKANPNLPTKWSFDVADAAGNVKHCGPVSTGLFETPTPTRTVTGTAISAVVVKLGERVRITNATVIGKVTVEPGGALEVTGSRVVGGIVATGPVFLGICGSQIVAPLTNLAQGVVVSGATGLVRIGDPAKACSANKVTGGVSLTSGSGGLTLGANLLAGNVTVSSNSVGTPTVKANSVVGTLACTGNNPPPVNAGQPNTAVAKSGQCTAV